MALVASAALGLGMTACGGGTIGYMWVLGTYYNQISGFLIDDYTGNLTATTNSPYSSGGTNPAMLLVKPGGRFVYVINSGATITPTAGKQPAIATGEGIVEYSVGSGGVLTYQNTYFGQGVQPIYASLDSTGNFLYVVDKYSPDWSSTGNGSITAFSIAGDTGRLTLIPNQAVLVNQVPQTWFEVGPSPVMTKLGSGSCLFTLSRNSIYPYAVNSSNGQLTTIQTGPYQVLSSNNLNSLNTSTGTSAASYMYLTDTGSNSIIALQMGTSCALSPIPGYLTANVSPAQAPVNSLTSQNGKFLYVINQASSGGTVATTSASISAFTINTQGQLTVLSDSTNNPYAVGAGPVCMVQDPSNQYIYVSDSADSTVTGKLVDQNRGFLSDLTRGTVFPTTKTPSCLAVSGNL
jgi:6-phosphogluconolactonase (cycloisomerase 2 family)